MKTLEKLSDFRIISDFCENNSVSFRELCQNIIAVETDFEVDNFRFIHEDEIDEIQKDELKSDTYLLGCFNADFLADIINVPSKAIKALQKAECYSELGEICLDYVNEIQKEYSRLDGYGHHFARYDGYTLEDILSISGYYVFRVN